MDYEEHEKELDAILNEAQGRGNNEFYTHLEKRLTQLSSGWSTKDENGELTREEITKLIQREHFIRGRINELKNSP